MHRELEGPEGGPPVVCLHGGIGTGRYHWSRQVDALATDHRVHLPDLPGHGGSPLPEAGGYSYELLAEAIEAYLADLGEPAHVIGFSMGGHAALRVVAARPELFASLALVGVVLWEHPDFAGWRARFDPDRLEADFPSWARALAKLHSPLGAEAWRDVLVRDAGGALELGVDLAALAGVDVPTLLARGDRDPVVPASQYAKLREVWPHADELVVPYGGHDVQLTRHGLVRPALIDFLDRAKEV